MAEVEKDKVRELLDEYGADAGKLNEELRRIGDHRVSERLIAIARALRRAAQAE